MAELRTLRAERQAVRDQALAEAQLLAQHAQSKGEKYDPACDFPPQLTRSHNLKDGMDSDFSVAAITRLIARNQRLDEARDFVKNRFNPKPGATIPAAA